VLAQWAANGWDCPSGLLGSDPVASPVDPTPSVVQSSAGCFLFHVFLRTLLGNVFADDLAAAGMTVSEAAVKPMLFLLESGSDAFCSDVGADGAITPHTCAEQVAIALGQAYAELVVGVGPAPSDWVWGRHHTITTVSQLALVTTSYTLGPYARPGGQSTVDVGSPIAIAGSGIQFAVNTGANLRQIAVMDPARPIVKMQLPGPERDSRAYGIGPDLLGQWVRNTYFDFAFGDQIAGTAVAIQRFDPKEAP
jgi:acyl-homoserine lactone acylase PvdQ